MHTICICVLRGVDVYKVRAGSCVHWRIALDAHSVPSHDAQMLAPRARAHTHNTHTHTHTHTHRAAVAISRSPAPLSLLRMFLPRTLPLSLPDHVCLNYVFLISHPVLSGLCVLLFMLLHVGAHFSGWGVGAQRGYEGTFGGTPMMASHLPAAPF